MCIILSHNESVASAACMKLHLTYYRLTSKRAEVDFHMWGAQHVTPYAWKQGSGSDWKHNTMCGELVEHLRVYSWLVITTFIKTQTAAVMSGWDQMMPPAKIWLYTLLAVCIAMNLLSTRSINKMNMHLRCSLMQVHLLMELRGTVVKDMLHASSKRQSAYPFGRVW